MKHNCINVAFTCALLFMATYLSAQNLDTTYYETGEISAIGAYDSKGRESGNWISYRENGLKISEGEYKKGKKVGKWRVYGLDENLEEFWIYKKGDLVEKTLPDNSPVTFSTIERMPEFPGGADSLMSYIGNAIRYPDDAKEQQIEGNSIVSFVVDEDGKVEDIFVRQSVCPSIDQEVIRVVSEMPQWTPGVQFGKTVKVQYNLPVNFSLPKKKK